MPSPNKRQAAKAATRIRVMDAARRLWAQPGSYEAATMRVIASEAGMSTGAIFANFASKEDLWREVMGYEPPVDGPDVRHLLRSLASIASVRAAA